MCLPAHQAPHQCKNRQACCPTRALAIAHLFPFVCCGVAISPPLRHIVHPNHEAFLAPLVPEWAHAHCPLQSMHSPTTRCLEGPVDPKGCSHIMLTLLATTSGAHQGQMARCGHLGGRGAQGHCWLLWLLWVAGYCGWLTPSSGWWGAPIAPTPGSHVVLPLLGATSSAHQGQMVALGHHWGRGAQRYCWPPQPP